MTTDERLDRLVERHEALAQSVELLGKHMEKMRGFVSEIAEGTARLLHIAQIHEHRITRLEDKGTHSALDDVSFAWLARAAHPPIAPDKDPET